LRTQEAADVVHALKKFIKAPVFSNLSIGRNSYGSPPGV
jgi:hypothetical protein